VKGRGGQAVLGPPPRHLLARKLNDVCPEWRSI
jgi:hypothetical protein